MVTLSKSQNVRASKGERTGTSKRPVCEECQREGVRGTEPERGAENHGTAQHRHVPPGGGKWVPLSNGGLSS